MKGTLENGAIHKENNKPRIHADVCRFISFVSAFIYVHLRLNKSIFSKTNTPQFWGRIPLAVRSLCT